TTTVRSEYKYLLPFMLRPPPTYPLFPYTTLFRSHTGSINLTVYETTGKDDESTIKNLYKLHHFERVLIAGGDGTIKLVAEALERSEEHTSELQSRENLVCRLLLEKKKEARTENWF